MRLFGPVRVSALILHAGRTTLGFLPPWSTLLRLRLSRRKRFCHYCDDLRPEDVQELGKFLFVVRGLNCPCEHMLHLPFLGGEVPGKGDVTPMEVAGIGLPFADTAMNLGITRDF